MGKLHFSKDLSLASACLVFFGLLNSADSVRLLLTDPFFS